MNPRREREYQSGLYADETLQILFDGTYTPPFLLAKETPELPIDSHTQPAMDVIASCM